MKQFLLGVDIGGTAVKMGILKTDGTMLTKWEIPTNTNLNGKYILPDIAASIRTTLKTQAIERADVLGVGVGVPGAVLAGGLVNRCVNLGWGVTPVEGLLSKELDGMPVTVMNDADAAAYGEQWMGSGRGYDNLVLLTLGTGIGGGVIIGGRVVNGAFGGAGEIGHIPSEEHEKEPCNCGNYGCLEQYASATGIVRMANKRLKETGEPSRLRAIENITAKDVFDAAKQKDALAREQVEAFGMRMGRALAGVSCVVDPDVYIIGGGVSHAGTIVTETIRRHYRTFAFHASRETEFLLAGLGNDAGIYGCARAVMD